jgi:phosphoserine aminotransferase
MQGKINFNAGPAAMPSEVLHDASKAVRKYKNTGVSILELPHRGKDFMDIIEESNALVKELGGLNDDYSVVWMHGGGRMQFCMVPMNFLPEDGTAGYMDSGHWAHEAMEYAGYYGKSISLSSAEDTNYSELPKWPAKMPKDLSYIHLTTNSTVYGMQWQEIPETKVPLIADMSSDIFSRKHDYSRYAMFYATAQKNLGTAGVALAVIRKDMLDRIARKLPPMLDYKAQVAENSILNTANIFGVYVSLLTLRWIKEKGIEAIEKANNTKAALLYDAIDRSNVFEATVTNKAHRSPMNVRFVANTPENEKAFLELCAKNQITGIKGHRSVGGFRASLYNAVPLESVELLVRLMGQFSK